MAMDPHNGLRPSKCLYSHQHIRTTMTAGDDLQSFLGELWPPRISSVEIVVLVAASWFQSGLSSILGGCILAAVGNV
jgi:hypothetical protein